MCVWTQFSIHDNKVYDDHVNRLEEERCLLKTENLLQYQRTLTGMYAMVFLFYKLFILLTMSIYYFLSLMANSLHYFTYIDSHLPTYPPTNFIIIFGTGSIRIHLLNTYSSKWLVDAVLPSQRQNYQIQVITLPSVV